MCDAHAGVIAASVPAAALILWLYRKELLGPIPDYSKVLSTVGQYRVTDWDLMAKSGAALLAPHNPHAHCTQNLILCTAFLPAFTALLE